MGKDQFSEFLSSVSEAPGFQKDAFINAHLTREPVVSIRFNPAKLTGNPEIKKSLPGIEERVSWSSHGYYLKERPLFTTDPLFHAGVYYVQEASSMFLEEALRQSADLSQPLKVLDLCAAPGGKSTLIQSVISPESLLVSNEVIKTRVNILTENLTKWGAANVVVTNNDAKDFKELPAFFDIIVVDAPCSGSGLFRKDPDAIEEWSPGNVTLCSQRQQRILADVFPALKQDGVLIYSTCSYSVEEDEAIADWLIADHGVESMKLELHADWNIVETISPQHKANGYRFYPDKLRGEGFFLSVFKKTGDAGTASAALKASRPEKLSRQEQSVVEEYLQHTSAYSLIKFKDDVLAFTSLVQEALPKLQSALYLKKAGVNMGN
ncbi:MAG: RsmB/NOP family class I SAM-dependent RNA methyltransferase, partial [Pedobacter sp.]